MSNQFNNSFDANQSKTALMGNGLLTNKSQVNSGSQRNGKKPPQQKPTKIKLEIPNDEYDAPGQWFKNLPIARKQLIAAGISCASVFGFILATGWIIDTNLRNQILLQSQSETAFVDTNYKIKIDQMGFGFRGQSENPTILQAAVEATKNNKVNPQLQSQVTKILQGEVKARTIEYATLVDKNMRIIASANAYRQGEEFNPNGLVAEVFRDSKQIKANAIVSWEELQQELPPLPEGFTNQDALIRYTVTPVLDPVTKQPIAALISGDIVSGKFPIVANTVQALRGGYSAVYFRQPNGQYVLASSLYQHEQEEFDIETGANEPLPDVSLLDQAIEDPGKAVSAELDIEGETIAVSALAIPNIYKQEATGSVPIDRGKPVAILVRGTPETALEMIAQGSAITQFLLGALVLALNAALAVAIGRAIAKPIEKLQETTEQFATGDRDSRAEILATDEVGLLSATFNQLADNIVDNEVALKEETIQLELARQETQKLAEQERDRNETLQRELLQFISNVEEASQGNLTVRADITAGEIGIVADMFNSIVENLRDIVSQVKQAAVQVDGSVGKNELAIQQLANEAIGQTVQISQTLNSVEAMTRSIQQVAENAQAAARVARTASTTAETGGEDMEQTVNSILQLRETVADTEKKVKRLGEASQQISKAVSLIDQIAMQTNLLAVNASIEAARAGEEGQGFAVVASEVGQLAVQSATATKEIAQIVDSIQQETSAAIASMKVSSDRVEEGTRLAEKTKQSLGKIVEVSRDIDRLLQSISQATVSQVNTSETVTQLMEEIAQVSQKTSDSSRQVSDTLQETVEIAKQLQSSVGTFRI